VLFLVAKLDPYLIQDWARRFSLSLSLTYTHTHTHTHKISLSPTVGWLTITKLLISIQITWLLHPLVWLAGLAGSWAATKGSVALQAPALAGRLPA
jgi:hypothetical protein